jgi:regulator of cell morphogenesis and NO signaling
MPVTLSELAIHLPASIPLFEHYGLDYYRNGKETLRTACAQKGLSFEEIDTKLSRLAEAPGVPYSVTLEDMSADRLIDFINGGYHANEELLLTNIAAQIGWLLAGDSSSAAALSGLAGAFSVLRTQLLMHCKKEDELLFPLLRKLANRHRTERTTTSDADAVKQAIRLLREEHTQITELLEAVSETTNRYAVPADALQEYTRLMKDLQQFEQEMHMHLHIENNILFPRLLALASARQPNKTEEP